MLSRSSGRGGCRNISDWPGGFFLSGVINGVILGVVMRNIRKDRTMAKKLARVGLRFDADLWRRLCKMADDADISVNQLMQGVARWR